MRARSSRPRIAGANGRRGSREAFISGADAGFGAEPGSAGLHARIVTGGLAVGLLDKPMPPGDKIRMMGEIGRCSGRMGTDCGAV